MNEWEEVEIVTTKNLRKLVIHLFYVETNFYQERIYQILGSGVVMNSESVMQQLEVLGKERTKKYTYLTELGNLYLVSPRVL